MFPDDFEYSVITTVPVVTEPLLLTTVKNWLRITLAETKFDTELNGLISRARAFGEMICRASFATQTKKMVIHNGFPYQVIRLPYGPVQSVSEVKYYIDGALATLGVGQYRFSDDIIQSVDTWPQVDNRIGAVEITYITGHDENNPLPEYLIDAMLQYITWGFENKLPDGDEPRWLVRLFKTYRRYT